ncbi:MAG: class II glutamine amidotransferase [Candidatus Hodarchaeales archaeon]|jgi:predicted glutamine amidotransferase
MCRLLGIYGERTNWREILFKFQELSEKGKIPRLPNIEPGHLDGWGMATSKPNGSGMDLIGKYLGNALEAPEYKEKVHSFENQPRVFLCHLRKASPEIPVTIPNSHPFIWSNWAFIHNGTVYDAANLKQSSRFQITSDNSDSEFLFHYLLATMLVEDNIESRTENLIQSLLQIKVQYSSLNFVLSNGFEMYAVRCAAKHQDYFSLFYQESGSGVIICSEKMGLDKERNEIWTEMPNQSVLYISGSPPKLKLIRF